MLKTILRKADEPSIIQSRRTIEIKIGGSIRTFLEVVWVTKTGDRGAAWRNVQGR
jgi:hypothetical protein